MDKIISILGKIRAKLTPIVDDVVKINDDF